jgi:hypothetical protein
MTNEQATEVAKSQAIGLRIMAMVDGGVSVCDAVDAVIGAGSFQKLAGEVYDTLMAGK